ncbi:MAG: hypothetical protein AAFY41_00515 [Bacteroidota bacterium]
MFPQDILGTTLVHPPNNDLNLALIKAIPQIQNQSVIYSGGSSLYQIPVDPPILGYMEQQIRNAKREPKGPRALLKSIRDLVFRDKSPEDLEKNYEKRQIEEQIKTQLTELKELDQESRKDHLTTLKEEEIPNQIGNFLTGISNGEIKLGEDLTFGNFNNRHGLLIKGNEIAIIQKDKLIFSGSMTPQGLEVRFPVFPEDELALTAAINAELKKSQAELKKSQARQQKHTYSPRKSQLGD